MLTNTIIHNGLFKYMKFKQKSEKPYMNDAKKLQDFCVKIGKNISLIQGAGGNISIKNNDIMSIKASGFCLADALEKDIFVDVSISQILASVDKGEESFLAIDNKGLRPSIETPLHALIPFPIVIHVHCINSIAQTLLPRTIEQLPTLLPDFNFEYINYARPGVPLAHLVQKALKGNSSADCFILQNHGLIIAGNIVEEVEEKLFGIVKKLQLQSRKPTNFDKHFLEEKNDLNWIIPTDSLYHTLATDSISFVIATKGLLFPDYVVFLGENIAVANENEALSIAYKKIKEEFKAEPLFILYPQKGIIISPQIQNGAKDIIYILAQICSMIDLTENEKYALKTLSQSDIYDLTNWDAEKYRQSLNIKQ